MSRVLVGVDYAQGKEEREQGEVRDAARVSRAIGALGRPVFASTEARGGGGERRGPTASRVADTEAHRQARGRAPRWSEASGRGRLQCLGAL